MTVCFLLIGTAAFSQERTITGVVTDSFKEPLIGVSIVVQGTNTGVVTGLDGDYSIQVPPNATLDFSYVGMEKQSIKVGNQSVINVQMKEDSQMLAETVVIGYGSAKKRDLTGSITNIKGDEIANKPVANPLSALKVKWPVYKSSTPVRQCRPGNPRTRYKLYQWLQALVCSGRTVQ